VRNSFYGPLELGKRFYCIAGWCKSFEGIIEFTTVTKHIETQSREPGNQPDQGECAREAAKKSTTTQQGPIDLDVRVLGIDAVEDHFIQHALPTIDQQAKQDYQC